jgi:hypothetical protein
MYEVSRYYSGKDVLCVVREDGEVIGQAILGSKAAADRFTARLTLAEGEQKIPACEGSELPLDGEYPFGSAAGTAA